MRMSTVFFRTWAVVAIFGLIGLAGCPSESQPPDEPTPARVEDSSTGSGPELEREGGDPMAIEVTSTAFAEGEKIPRKGGPGITRSDLLVINKIDLAPYVGASLEVMGRDSKRMRGERPFVFSNLREGQGLDEIAEFIVREGMLAASACA